MDANQILEKIKDSGVTEGTQFWYIYAVVVTSLLVLLIMAIVVGIKGFLASFLKDIKETNQSFSLSITKLTDNDAKLTSLVQLHEYQIERMEADIKEIRDVNKRRRQ